MENSTPITITMVSISPLPRTNTTPPQVPPRTKKRLNITNNPDINNNSNQDIPPELPSRAKDMVPPPIPSPSTKPPQARQVLQTKQLMEAEFLRSGTSQRQVLFAATKIGRERRPESRQRQPPAMLVRPDQKEAVMLLTNLEQEVSENVMPTNKTSPKKAPHFLVVPASKSIAPIIHHQSRGMFQVRTNQQQPMQLSRLIFPRPPTGHHLLPAANALPVSYGKWLERSGAGDPEINTRILRRIFGSHGSSKSKNAGSGGFKAILPQNLKVNQNNPAKSKPVVSRSGSLSSQYSSCSDSGNESQPKSVLKKSKKNKESEKPKKSVTFNAMTTVQVMEE